MERERKKKEAMTCKDKKREREVMPQIQWVRRTERHSDGRN